MNQLNFTPEEQHKFLSSEGPEGAVAHDSGAGGCVCAIVCVVVVGALILLPIYIL